MVCWQEDEEWPREDDAHQYLDDTWVASLRSSTSQVRWQQVASYHQMGLGPSPRYGNSVNHHRGRLVIFGGVGTNETFMQDTHLFSLWGFDV